MVELEDGQVVDGLQSRIVVHKDLWNFADGRAEGKTSPAFSFVDYNHPSLSDVR